MHEDVALNAKRKLLDYHTHSAVNLTWTELTDPMREPDSNMPTERSMINLQPPTSSDPHLPAAHAEPPPCSSSPPHTLSVSLSLSSRSPSTSDAIRYQPGVLFPFRHKGSTNAVARGVGGRFGRGWGGWRRGGGVHPGCAKPRMAPLGIHA